MFRAETVINIVLIFVSGSYICRLTFDMNMDERFNWTVPSAWAVHRPKKTDRQHNRVNLYILTAGPSAKWSAMLLSHHCQLIAGA
jgi:hypothetical protein